MEETLKDQFELIFEGIENDSPDTLRQIKGCLIADCHLSIPEVQNILSSAPIMIMRADSEKKLKGYFNALKRAGAKVLIVAPKGAGAEPEKDDTDSVATDGMEINADELFSILSVDKASSDDNEILLDQEPLETPSSPEKAPEESTVWELTLEPAPPEVEAILTEEPSASASESPQSTEPVETAEATVDISTPELALSTEPAPLIETHEPPPGTPIIQTPPDLDLTANTLPLELDTAPEPYPPSPAPPQEIEVSPPTSSPESDPPRLLELSLDDTTENSADIPQTSSESEVQAASPPEKQQSAVIEQSTESLSLSDDSPEPPPQPLLQSEPQPTREPPKLAAEDKTEMLLETIQEPTASKPPNTPQVQDTKPAATPSPPLPPSPSPKTTAQAQPESKPSDEPFPPVDTVPTSTKPPRKLRRKLPAELPLDLIAAVGIGAVVLGIGNWAYFTYFDTPTSQISIGEIPHENDDLKPIGSTQEAKGASTKKLAAAPTPAPTVTPESIRIEGENTTSDLQTSWKFSKDSKGLTSAFIFIATNPPPELTVQDIMQGIKKRPWLRKIEAQNLAITMKDESNFESSGAARVYVEDDSGRYRVVGQIVVKGTYSKETSSINASVEITNNWNSKPEDRAIAIEKVGNQQLNFLVRAQISNNK